VEKQIVLVDDYLENCNVFLACGDSYTNQEFLTSIGVENEDTLEYAETTSTGLATFLFENPADKNAEETGCSYTFDASYTDNGCIDVGTMEPPAMSQICTGDHSDCSVMSALCTMASFSAEDRMSFAFGADSLPKMDYGSCTPCDCDPMAALLGNEPQVAGAVDGRVVLDDAANQLSGITVATGFVALADAYFRPAEPIYPASFSPGRMAMTKEIDETPTALDMTDSKTVLRMLESAQGFWEASAGTRRLQDQTEKLENFAGLSADLIQWYSDEVEVEASNVGKINLANQFGASRDILAKSLLDENFDLSTASITDIIEEAGQSIPIYTASPTASPTFDGQLPGDGKDDGDDTAIIGGVVGGVGGAAALLILAYVLKTQKDNKDVDSSGKNFKENVGDNNAQLTEIGRGGDSQDMSPLDGGGAALATPGGVDDLPSATI
jgi:hypothetical protein